MTHQKLRVKYSRVSRLLTVLLVVLVLVSSALVGTMVLVRMRNALLDQEFQKLDRYSSSVVAEFRNVTEQAALDVQFLAHQQPVDDFLAAGSRKSFQALSDHEVADELSGMFVELASLHPEYYQIRLIDAQDNGKELVRVDNTDGNIMAITDPARLQEKGAMEYFRDTLTLPEGELYVSAIELNQEFNKISDSWTPVLRVATPLYFNDAEPAGFVIINLSLQTIFTKLKTLIMPEQTLFLMDERGEFLLHPDAQRTYAFERGDSFNMSDEFGVSADTLQGNSGHLEVADQGNIDRVLIYQKIYLNPLNPGSYYTVLISTETDLVMQPATALIGDLVQVILIVTLSGALATIFLFRPINARIERFELAVEQAPEGIAIANSKGTLQYGNKGFAEFIELPMSKVKGKQLGETVLCHLSTAQLSGYRNCLAEAQHWQTEFSITAGDGRSLWFQLVVQPVLDERGELNYQLIQVRDVSTQRQIEALQKTHDIAVESDRAKTRFLSHMSHELRSPLNAIIGFSELQLSCLKDGSSDLQSSLDNQNEIQNAGVHLLTVVNEVLEYARIQSDDHAVENCEFSINTLVREIVGLVKPIAQNKNLHFELACEPDLGTMETDASMLRRILLSLLSNAVRFTHEGVVGLSVMVRQDHGEEVLVFKVSDTGVGIEEAQRKQIFEPFYQKDNSDSRGYGGSGLGLTIAHKFAELLQGSLVLQQRSGRGTVFELVLPRWSSEQQTLTKFPTQNARMA